MTNTPLKKFNVYEFEKCLIYDNSPKPRIQVYDVLEGSTRQENLFYHAICCFMKGSASFTFTDKSRHEFRKGQMIFLPVGSVFSWTALEHAQLLIYRLMDDSFRLCENFPVERLYDSSRYIEQKQNRRVISTDLFSTLDIHPRMWEVMVCTRNCIMDGVKCRRYFEGEIEHFFLRLRFYHSKEELHDFLRFLVTGNLVFTEYIRLRWRNYRTVKALADSMNLTPKYFTRKFKQFFGQKPYQWLANNRARLIYNDLTTTTKPLKQIASDHGFSTFQQFAIFTKKLLGKTPTEIRSGSGVWNSNQTTV